MYEGIQNIPSNTAEDHAWPGITIGAPAGIAWLCKTAGSSFASRIKTSTDGRKYIVVTNGDTLFGISKQSGVTKDKIIRINSLKNDYAPLNTRIYLN